MLLWNIWGGKADHPTEEEKQSLIHPFYIIVPYLQFTLKQFLVS